jgi:hypothetical protein
MPQDSMANTRLPRAVCKVVAEVLRGNHEELNMLFSSAGAPGDPPTLPHATKWKEWLFRAGTDPKADSLSVLGNILEEFMDLAPADEEARFDWKEQRERVVKVLEEYGFRYYRGGRVLPLGQLEGRTTTATVLQAPVKPTELNELLEVLLKGLRRAMHPLTHRRKGAQSLSFSTEYDVQDLLHALLRPWIADIRPEEFTPSYGNSSTRMDFLLPKYKLVIELKFLRETQPGRKIGDELIVDIEHYRRHPDCDHLWCVVFDENHQLANVAGLKDLEGERSTKDGKINVLVFFP